VVVTLSQSAWPSPRRKLPTASQKRLVFENRSWIAQHGGSSPFRTDCCSCCRPRFACAEFRLFNNAAVLSLYEAQIAASAILSQPRKRSVAQDLQVTTWALCIGPPLAKLIRDSWFVKVIVMSERSTEQIRELLRRHNLLR
jgi:hypothetical protein